jgi:hypothetical protein
VNRFGRRLAAWVLLAATAAGSAATHRHAGLRELEPGREGGATVLTHHDPLSPNFHLHAVIRVVHDDPCPACHGQRIVGLASNAATALDTLSVRLFAALPTPRRALGRPFYPSLARSSRSPLALDFGTTNLAGPPGPARGALRRSSRSTRRKTMRKASWRALAILAATIAFAAGPLATPARAAGTAGSIRGTITGPDGKPLGGVPVELRNDITGFKADTRTAADGTYQFFGVPFNPYELHVEVQGFQPVHHQVDVRSSIPRQVDLALALPAVAESVHVTGEPTAAQLETDTSMSHIDIDKSYIERVPAAVASRAMEDIVTSTPGFSKDENGRYHFQGAHSQNEYVIDGQTISDQTGVTFSNSIDPGIARSIEVIYGNVPAEYGEKVGSVINMVTKSSLGSVGLKGEVYGGYARFDTYEAGASVGAGSQTFGFFTSIAASGSDYFTDPVNPDNLNNHGDTQRAFLRFDAATPNLSQSFRLTTLLAGRTATSRTRTPRPPTDRTRR